MLIWVAAAAAAAAAAKRRLIACMLLLLLLLLLLLWATQKRFLENHTKGSSFPDSLCIFRHAIWENDRN
jgi:hypothetical protein